MQRCIISTNSLTFVQKGRRLLSDYALRSEVVSLNGIETKSGCSYGIEIDCSQADNAIRLFERFGIPYHAIIRRNRP
ncbi:MAG: DUF3343 domain-containing protein [Eubacteriales bacterium]|jgi:hypothetical protein|nr:DUF3343 domain-containing protein [Eubacteriales bacterium]